MSNNLKHRHTSLCVRAALLGVLPMLGVNAASAATITVNSLADAPPAADGSCTLREAISNANGDDDSGSIDCAVGTAADTIAFSTAGTITLTDALPDLTDNQRTTIDGDTDADGHGDIVISGDAAERCFFVDEDAVADLVHLTITDCEAAYGAGITNLGSLAIRHSTISNNVAPASGVGGGILNISVLTISHSSVSDNAAGGSGGGIFSDLGATLLSITHSTVSGNTAGNQGGGIKNYAPLVIVNSTISGNSALQDGGGIDHDGESLTLSWSTVTGNDAFEGAGIYNHDQYATSIVSASIVANNEASVESNCVGTIGDGGGNLFWPASDPSCGASFGDPALGPLQDNGGPTLTHVPGPVSAAIDATVCAGTVIDDQRGVARPQGATCDIGAVEVRADAIFANGFE